MSVDNKIFDKTYDKLITKLEKQVYQYTINKRYYGKINYNKLKKLLIMIKYLERVKDSRYNYYYVNYLTEISNYLNKI